MVRHVAAALSAAAALAVGGFTVIPLAVPPAAAASGHHATQGHRAQTAGHRAGKARKQKVVISVAKSKTMGNVLVDDGQPLYVQQGPNASCTGACLSVWPAVVLPTGVTKARAGKGVAASKLGVVTRQGGGRQVTYGGQPLYRFQAAKNVAAVTGSGVQDSFGSWTVVVTSKGKAAPHPSKPPAPTTTPGAGGYGY